MARVNYLTDEHLEILEHVVFGDHWARRPQILELTVR